MRGREEAGDGKKVIYKKPMALLLVAFLVTWAMSLINYEEGGGLLLADAAKSATRYLYPNLIGAASVRNNPSQVVTTFVVLTISMPFQAVYLFFSMKSREMLKDVSGKVSWVYFARLMLMCVVAFIMMAAYASMYFSATEKPTAYFASRLFVIQKYDVGYEMMFAFLVGVGAFSVAKTVRAFLVLVKRN